MVDKETITRAEKEIYGKDFQIFGEYAEVVTLLEMKREISDIEFRIYYLENANVYIDKRDVIVSS